MAKKYSGNNTLLFLFQLVKGMFVPKETGKGLSTNDFTDDYMTKLEGVASGAEVNVQSDWNATTGDAFIKNKPTIPSVASTTLVANGTASVGTSAAYARADHVHPSDSTRVPTTRKVNGKTLSADVTLAASDVGAVPTTRTVNGKPLTSNVTLAASDVNAIPTASMGIANGVCPLNASRQIDSTYLPGYVDDVIEGYYSSSKFYAEESHATVIAGERGKIYLDLTTDTSYRWSGTTWIPIVSSDMVELTNEEVQAIWDSV